MKPMRSLAVLLALVALVAIGLSVQGELNILLRALVLSWDYPVTQAQDELRVLASPYADPCEEVQRRVLPVRGTGARYVTDRSSRHECCCCPALPTRAPPSA
jgi:hypothetical protein